MPQPLALLGQGDRLAGIDGGLTDTTHQLLELAAPALGVGGGLPGLRQLLAGRAQLAPGGGHGGAQLVVAGGRVEQVELRGGAGQAPRLVLRGHLEQQLAQLLEIVAGAAPPPHQRPAAAAGGDPPRHHERRLALRAQRRHRLRSQLLEEPVGDRELGLDVGLRSVRADHAGDRCGTGQQPDRLRQHRLAGAGLAGEDVQARPQLQLGAVDQGQVVDLQAQQRHAVNVSR